MTGEQPEISTEEYKAEGRGEHDLGNTNNAASNRSPSNSGVDDIHLQHAAPRQTPQNGKGPSARRDRFKLQEAPRAKRSVAGGRSPCLEAQLPSGNTTPKIGASSSTEVNYSRSITDQHRSVSDNELPKSHLQHVDWPPRTSSESRHHDELPVDSTQNQTPSASHQSDVQSTRSEPSGDAVPRKPVSNKTVAPQLRDSSSNSTEALSHSYSAPLSVNIEDSEPSSGIINIATEEALPSTDFLPGTDPGFVNGQGSAQDGQAPSSPTYDDAFTAPRAPPQPPIVGPISPLRSSSISHLNRLHNTDTESSGGLPQHSMRGNLNMEDDLERILGGDDEVSASLLRRVSNVVKHGRSFSDNETRVRTPARWPKSPIDGVTPSPHVKENGSPTTTSPESEGENAQLKNELRRSAQRIVELEARVSGGTDITTFETKLREKRSTVAMLDSQRELVVRELELLTEHIAEAKHSRAPLDVNTLKTKVVRQFAEELQELKAKYMPEIEDLVKRKNELLEETTNLTRVRDQAIQETEQLNMKNAQLADLNNELTQQIQERYRVHREGGGMDSPRPFPNGLGIYGPHKFRTDADLDGRESRLGTGHGTSNASGPGNPSEQNETDSALLAAPHVVNIRKGQVKKFNWKKGSQSVAKGVSKGIKGAFSSSSQTQPQYQRDVYVPETMPYGMAPLIESPTSNIINHNNSMSNMNNINNSNHTNNTNNLQPINHNHNNQSSQSSLNSQNHNINRSNADTPRHGLGRFGQKSSKNGPTRMQSNGNLSGISVEAPSSKLSIHLGF